MPDAPVAAPVAAPAAPSAPASSPSSSAPSSSAPPGAHSSVPATPPAAGTIPAPAASVPIGPQPPAKPDPKEYSNASDWYMADTAYQASLQKFKEENPDFKMPEAAPAPASEAAAAGENPSKLEEKQQEQGQEQPKTEDSTEDLSWMSAEDGVTPQAVNDFIAAKPERADYLKNDPDMRNMLFKMSRENAQLAQFKGIFPNKESAIFSKQAADRSVALRSQFQQAETPELMASAFDNFIEEFAVKGADGKQVIDEHGEPVYGDDLYLFGEQFISRYANSTLEEVQSRLQENKYASPADRQEDEDKLIMAKMVLEDLTPASAEKPKRDYSKLPEDVRKELEARENELSAREKAFADKTAKNPAQERKAARAAADKQFFDGCKSRLHSEVNKTIELVKKQGVAVPDWMLTTTMPGTDIPIFNAKIGQEIDALIKGDPWTANRFQELAQKPPTPENIQQRIKAFDELMQQDNNLRRIVMKVVRGHGAEVARQAQQAANPPTTAAPEPRGGSTPSPQAKPMSKDDAYRAAEKKLEKEDPQWKNYNTSERMALVFTEQSKILQSQQR